MYYKAIHQKLIILNHRYLDFLKLIAAVLLIIASYNQSSNYYSWLRILIFIISIYSLYESKVTYDILGFNAFTRNEQKGIYILFFLTLAVLFNPLVPIYFYDKSIWNYIDFAGIIIFISSFFSSNKFGSSWNSALIIYDFSLRHSLNSSNLISFVMHQINIASRRNYHWNNDYETIYNLLQKAIEIDPLNPEAYFYRSVLKLRDTFYMNEDIIRDLRNAIKLGEKNNYVNLYLGIAMLWEIIPQLNNLRRLNTLNNLRNKKSNEANNESFIDQFFIEIPGNNQIKKNNEAINESLFDCTVVFRNQILQNNSSVAYLCLSATFFLMTEKKVASKVILPENCDEVVDEVLKIIEPEEQNFSVYVSQRFMKYSVKEFMLKITPILEKEDKNFMK